MHSPESRSRFLSSINQIPLNLVGPQRIDIVMGPPTMIIHSKGGGAAAYTIEYNNGYTVHTVHFKLEIYRLHQTKAHV